MAVFDLFSKRQKRERGELPDVYQYDTIPPPLRVQIMHIIEGVTEAMAPADSEKTIVSAYRTLCREYGVFDLYEGHDSRHAKLRSFVVNCEADKVLDFVEVFFHAAREVMEHHRHDADYRWKVLKGLQEGIDELNVRFRENAVGYQYQSRRVIRVDSQVLHAEAVKPALKLLTGREYAGANEEFLKAHEHYRNGRCKECVNECLKAFESVMKAICEKRGWVFDKKDTANQLIEVCLHKNLVPAYLQSQFAALRSILESGVPTMRNITAAHGQGARRVEVPEHFAAYVLHLTASNIVFLVESEKALK